MGRANHAVHTTPMVQPSHPNILGTVSWIEHAQISACAASFVLGAAVDAVLRGAAFGAVLVGAEVGAVVLAARRSTRRSARLSSA